MDAIQPHDWTQVKKVKFHHRVKRFYYKNLFRKIYTVAIIGLIGANVFSILKYSSFAEGGIRYTPADSSGYGTITISNPENPSEGFTILDRNLGATTTGAGSSASSDSYGYYYQWGNNNGNLGDSEVSTTLLPWDPSYSHKGYNGENKGFIRVCDDSGNCQSKNDIWSDGELHDDLWGGENDSESNNWGLDDISTTATNRQGPCPEGYHVPSAGEWSKIIEYRCRNNPEKCNMSNMSLDAGFYHSNSRDTNLGLYFAQDLYIPFAGYISSYKNDIYYSDMSDGIPMAFLWSSSPFEGGIHVHNLRLSNREVDSFGYYHDRADGFPIRCVSNSHQIAIQQFTISFVSNGGSSVASQDVVGNTTGTRPDDPKKTGYSFGGRYESENLEGEDFDFETSPITSDITLYAKWECKEGHTYNGYECVEVKSDGCPEGMHSSESGICECDVVGAEIKAGQCTLKFRKNGVDYYPMSTNLGYNPNYTDGAIYKWGAKEGLLYPDTIISSSEWGAMETSDWSSNTQGPCPEGYHVPTGTELQMMTTSYAGNWQRMMSELNLSFAGYRNGNGVYYATAGDSSGIPNQTSNTKNELGIYLSSNKASSASKNVQYVIIFNNVGFYTRLGNSGLNKNNGGSVRCFKNSDEKYVTIHGNGGEPKLSVGKIEGGSVVLPDITREGYQISRYTTDIEGNNEYDLTQGANEEIVLYAQWNNKLYTITYHDSNNAEADVIYTGAYNSSTAEAIAPKWSREGYTLSWDREKAENYPAENIVINSVWTVNEHKLSFVVDGNEIQSENVAYGSNISAPANPSKECNSFVGWSSNVGGLMITGTMPDSDVVFSVNWNYTCSRSSGGGRRTSKTAVDTHNSADNTPVSSGIDTKESEKNSKNSSPKTSLGKLDMEKYDPNYSLEQNQTYQFAYNNGITTKGSIKSANMTGKITRVQMAKMLSYYAINVLGMEPDYSKGTKRFTDVSSKLDKQYDNGVTLAYQLGIMGVNMKNNKFRPYDYVTRAEFSTALSRMLYGIKDGTGKTKYYEPHMAKLYYEGIINKRDPKMKELRGYVMLMLMRSI